MAKLLYFDSSKEGGLTSLDEYVGRDASDDEKIYYLHAPTRELALASPYYEQFKKNKRECLFVYNAIDDFVMSNIREHNGRAIVTAEAADFGTSDEQEEEKEAFQKQLMKIQQSVEMPYGARPGSINSRNSPHGGGVLLFRVPTTGFLNNFCAFFDRSNLATDFIFHSIPYPGYRI